MTPAEQIRRGVPYQIAMIVLAGVLALTPLLLLSRLDTMPPGYDPDPPPRFSASEVPELEVRLIGLSPREVVDLLGRPSGTFNHSYMTFYVANTWSPLFWREKLFLNVTFENSKVESVESVARWNM